MKQQFTRKLCARPHQNCHYEMTRIEFSRWKSTRFPKRSRIAPTMTSQLNHPHANASHRKMNSIRCDSINLSRLECATRVQSIFTTTFPTWLSLGVTCVCIDDPISFVKECVHRHNWRRFFALLTQFCRLLIFQICTEKKAKRKLQFRLRNNFIHSFRRQGN